MLAVSSTAEAKSSNPAFLGIQMENQNGNVGPCRVSGVTKDSAAESAGVRANDLVITMESKSIGNCDQLVSEIQAKAPGDIIKLVVARDGRHVTVSAKLMSRDEVLRRRFGGLPVPTTKLVRVDDKRAVDISSNNRQTTIIGWYPTTCAGCDQVFTAVAKWSREERKSSLPIKVAAATAGDIRMGRSVNDNVELLKSQAKLLDVPLLVADKETYEHFAIGDGDRIQFMVIDCKGIVQHAAPIVPSSDDYEAVLDELFAAAEQAARKK